MKIKKLEVTIEESRERENIIANNERYKYLFEYMAMMTGVDLPIEEANDNE